MIRKIVAAVLLCFGLSGGASGAFACGPQTRCELDNGRYYHIRMPAGHDGKTPIGAIVYAHGYRGQATTAVQSQAFVDVAAKLNVAIISGKSLRSGWFLPGSPSYDAANAVDEVGYTDRVIEDAASRYPIDRRRIMITGFSGGGMLTWTIACERGNRYAAYVPIAGTFWEPVPETCDAPVANIIHIHGDADPTVPLKGRRIRQAKQGEVAAVFEMYAEYGNFDQVTPLAAAAGTDLMCQNLGNAAGNILAFCLFKGGHSFSARYVEYAWRRFAAAGKL